MPSPENHLAVVPSLDYNTEFRAHKDDAWYSVALVLHGETLRIKYLDFSDDHDNLFEAKSFDSLEQLEEFKGRFRPLSVQLQDDECHKLRQGVRICASYSFSPEDIRFYDAVVDAVQENKHSFSETGDESCLCTFILSWLHGPNDGTLTTATIENICMVQPTLKLDPIVASFLEMAREKRDFISSGSISVSKGVTGWEMVEYYNEGSNTASRRGFFDRLRKETRCAKRSVVKVCSSQVSSHGRRMEDSDLEGIKNQCMILIGNLDKDLCPWTTEDFLRKHTSVLSKVYIFPSFSSEMYTRGAIVVDSEKDFQKLCDFLGNPNHMIISSTGRPWVIIEKLVGLKKIKASIGTLMPTSKTIVQNGSSGKSHNLKVVGLGSQEFKKASDLRDLFLAFSDHQQRLYKRLEVEERRIFCR